MNLRLHDEGILWFLRLHQLRNAGLQWTLVTHWTQHLWQSRNGHHVRWKEVKVRALHWSVCWALAPVSLKGPNRPTQSKAVFYWLVCHAQWQHDGWTDLMDLPIFHGRHSSHTQIQIWKEKKRTYYWAVRHSITPICQQIFLSFSFFFFKIGSSREKEKRGDLLDWRIPAYNLCSRQHHVVLPNGAGQTMLHRERNNKSAAPADNDGGLNHGVERSEQCK